MEYELDVENNMAYQLNDSGGVVNKLSGHDFMNLMKQTGGTLYRKGRNGSVSGQLSTGVDTNIGKLLFSVPLKNNTTSAKAVTGDTQVVGSVEGKEEAAKKIQRTWRRHSKKGKGKGKEEGKGSQTALTIDPNTGKPVLPKNKKKKKNSVSTGKKGSKGKSPSTTRQGSGSTGSKGKSPSTSTAVQSRPPTAVKAVKGVKVRFK